MKLGANEAQSEIPTSKKLTKKVDKSNVPKKGKTSYMCYMQKNVKKTMEELKTTKIVESAKLLGEKWGKMSDKEKKPYTDMANADGLRHDKQIKELKAHGYFFLEDGSKSTDPKKSKKRTHAEANDHQKHDGKDSNGLEDSELGSLLPNAKKQKVN